VLPESAAASRLLVCCGSKAWAWKVARARPLRTPDELFAAAETAFDQLDRDDWLEVFAAHPRIGERATGEDQSSRWSEQEQAGTEGAPAEILDELAQANRLYEDRFGHVFLVCATGKSAFEMLNLLSDRLGNDRETELKVAAGEQRKITRLRLEKML
jgi:OHCU decarboxylase